MTDWVVDEVTGALRSHGFGGAGIVVLMVNWRLQGREVEGQVGVQ